MHVQRRSSTLIGEVWFDCIVFDLVVDDQSLLDDP